MRSVKTAPRDVGAFFEKCVFLLMFIWDCAYKLCCREMDGKVYEAYIKKKAQAEKEYQEALESGHTAAHVGTK